MQTSKTIKHSSEINTRSVARRELPKKERLTVLPSHRKRRGPVSTTMATKAVDPLYALVDYGDDYVQPKILAAVEALLPKDRLILVSSPSAEVSLAELLPTPDARILQISPYEAIDFDYAAAHVGTSLVNSYVIRKALIRKHFLSATVDHWVAKHPDSVLRQHVKRSEAFEVDYAEFLDDALVEAFDLRASLERNADEPHQRQGRLAEQEWWILKPGMSDRGQGIRLFSTMAQLQDIFDSWEAEQPESDEDDDDCATAVQQETHGQNGSGDYIMTAHLRHFVAQPYIHPPLLLPGDPRKFHIRTYVLCVGSLRVYVYRDMLALFAAKSYLPPWESTADNLDAHLTNTCLQGDAAQDGATVKRFWDLGDLAAADGREVITKEAVFDQICAVTGEVFEAAARGMMVHFQPLTNAFEVFGLDFLVDAGGKTWLLEVNAFPDFKQTGHALAALVAEFWAATLRLAVGPFVGMGRGHGVGGTEDMVLVREIDLGRR